MTQPLEPEPQISMADFEAEFQRDLQRAADLARAEATAAEQAEHLEPWQLPIDADERMMKASTTKALIDLNQRRRKLTNQQVIGTGQQRWRIGIKF